MRICCTSFLAVRPRAVAEMSVAARVSDSAISSFSRASDSAHCVSSRLGSRIGAIALPAAWLGAGAPTALPPPSAPRGLAQHTVPSQVALERAASAPLSSHLHSTRALAIDQCRCARAASVTEALCVHRRGCPNSSPPQRKRVIVKALGERSAQTTQLVEHGRRR